MGEAYKTREARLGRDDAIKILPAEFAQNPERLWQFEHVTQAAAAPGEWFSFTQKLCSVRRKL